MKFKEISALLDGIPYMKPAKAKPLYEFLLDTKPKECLELGFAHGTSSCYIAAALEEYGGHLTTVDRLESKNNDPNIEQLLDKTGLQKYVTVLREVTSYNWFLKKKIEERTKDNNCEPLYDFCFLDGGKDWTSEGLAFFAVDKLLNTGGTILFDDYGWTAANYEKRTGKTGHAGFDHRAQGEDELKASHIELIFKLLVMQHPDYSDFRIEEGMWAWARKVKSQTKTVKLVSSVSFKAKLVSTLRQTLPVGRRKPGRQARP